MADILERLRAITGQAGDHGDVQLCDEAADEIERLRAQPCPYVTGTVTHYCTLTPAPLTDAERQVITWAANAMRPECRATLRGLLERQPSTPPTHTTPRHRTSRTECTSRTDTEPFTTE